MTLLQYDINAKKLEKYIDVAVCIKKEAPCPRTLLFSINLKLAPDSCYCLSPILIQAALSSTTRKLQGCVVSLYGENLLACVYLVLIIPLPIPRQGSSDTKKNLTKQRSCIQKALHA